MKLASGLIAGQEVLIVVTDREGREGWTVDQLAVHYGQNSEHWTMATYLSRADAGGLVAEWAARADHDHLPTVGDWGVMAPVSQSGKILCVGLNYHSHAQESKMEVPSTPVLFNKFSSSLVGPGTPVTIPADAGQIDYEAELVLVVGKPCRLVSEEQALDYVAGYCNGNDLSSRTLQFRTSQWLLGKALDGFAPIGPYVVTPDEIPNPDALGIRGWRNDELVQDSNTNRMIFSCRYLVSYLSRYMTLLPGDLIFTGTPEGVILGKPDAERQWLRPGERFTVEIDGLGKLTNGLI